MTQIQPTPDLETNIPEANIPENNDNDQINTPDQTLGPRDNGGRNWNWRRIILAGLGGTALVTTISYGGCQGLKSIFSSGPVSPPEKITREYAEDLNETVTFKGVLEDKLVEIHNYPKDRNAERMKKTTNWKEDKYPITTWEYFYDKKENEIDYATRTIKDAYGTKESVYDSDNNDPLTKKVLEKSLEDFKDTKEKITKRLLEELE